MMEATRIQRADDVSRLLITTYRIPVMAAVQAGHVFNDLSTNLGRWSVLLQCGLSTDEAEAALTTLGYVTETLAWN